MSEEDPKRIWVDNTILNEFDMELCPESDVEYVRADIVEEMREALKEVLAAERFSNKPPETVMQAEEKLDRIKQAVIKAEAALKRLEE